MDKERLTNIPDFSGKRDSGVFETKVAAALNEVASSVFNSDNNGIADARYNRKVTIVPVVGGQ
ncbi:hypothetical protein ACQ3G7_10400 [Kosakonia oryzendophytica]|uniref:hypothetical protein n=1 Tax=Kosakonia oryzendophytica TaxID=1005665 RepID=UPI003D3499FE